MNVESATGAGGIDLVAAFTGALAGETAEPEAHQREEMEAEACCDAVAPFDEWLASATQPSLSAPVVPVVPVLSGAAAKETMPARTEGHAPRSGDAPGREPIALPFEATPSVEIERFIGASPSADAVRFAGTTPSTEGQHFIGATPPIEAERSIEAAPSIEKQLGVTLLVGRAEPTDPERIMGFSKHDFASNVRHTPEPIVIPEAAPRTVVDPAEPARPPSSPAMAQQPPEPKGSQIPRGTASNGVESEAKIDLADARAPDAAGDRAPVSVVLDGTTPSDASPPGQEEAPSHEHDSSDGDSATSARANVSESSVETPPKPAAPLPADSPLALPARESSARSHPSLPTGAPLAMHSVRETAHPAVGSPAPSVVHPASPDETHLAWTPQIRHELAAKTRSFLERGETEIRITLDPPELGKLSIKLEIGPGRVAAHLVATNAHAAALLDRDRSDLIRAFEAQGIDDVSVHVGAERSPQEDSQTPARRSQPGVLDAQNSTHSRADEPSRARRARRSAVDLVA